MGLETAINGPRRRGLPLRSYLRTAGILQLTSDLLFLLSKTSRSGKSRGDSGLRLRLEFF